MLLLDLDGVLLHNHKIQKHIEERSVAFILQDRRFREKYKDDSVSFGYKMNKIGYKSCGHTARWLENTKQCALEYNDYVYDDNTLNFVRNNLTEADYYHLQKVQHLLEDMEMDIGLCTNTPIRYCETILYPGFGTSHVNRRLLENSFTSDTGLLKPNPDFYDACECKDEPIYFVDDSRINVEGIQSRPNWFGIHVTDRTDLYKELMLIQSLPFISCE